MALCDSGGHVLPRLSFCKFFYRLTHLLF